MKTIAYYPMLYGKEYLEASIKSIEPCVDKIIILFTSTPSFGNNIDSICPETEDELKAIALNASHKVEWHRIASGFEGHHRSLINNYSNGYDIVLAVDSDEIWDTDSLRKCLLEAYEGKAWRYNIAGFINFWKSFEWICTDSFVPARIYNQHNPYGTEAILTGKVYHFGCAQSDIIMNYKWMVHGHASEIRPGWLQDVYYGWTPELQWLHPVSLQIWPQADRFDKSTLPDILKHHPNFEKTFIS